MWFMPTAEIRVWITTTATTPASPIGKLVYSVNCAMGTDFSTITTINNSLQNWPKKEENNSQQDLPGDDGWHPGTTWMAKAGTVAGEGHGQKLPENRWPCLLLQISAAANSTTIHHWYYYRSRASWLLLISHKHISFQFGKEKSTVCTAPLERPLMAVLMLLGSYFQ